MKKVQIASIMVIVALVGVAFTVPVSANPGTRWDSLNAYMTENYDADVEGGYSLPDGEASRLYPTYGAAMVLDERGLFDYRPPSVDILKLKNFTRKIQWKSGGEDYDRYGAFAIYIAGPVSTEYNYYGLKLWELLSQEKFSDIPQISKVEINETAGLVFLNKTQTEAGGFGRNVDETPDIISTFQSLYVMDYYVTQLGKSMDEYLWNRTATIEWILDCSEGDGFKLHPNSNLPSLQATTAGLMALDILGELSRIGDTSVIRNWILDRQVLDSDMEMLVGGFEEGNSTNDPNLKTTHAALEALELLTAMDNVNKSVAARFIVNCQAADGSWGNVPEQETGRLFYAGLAVDALRLLDESGTYTTLLFEEDPNNPAGPIIDWRLGLIIGIIIVAAVVGIIATRFD